VNYDYPKPMHGAMVKQQLARMAMDAQKFYALLDDNDEIPSWVQMQVNVAQDRLGTAADYLDYKAGGAGRSGRVIDVEFSGVTDEAPRQAQVVTNTSAPSTVVSAVSEMNVGKIVVYGLAGAGVLWLMRRLIRGDE